MRRKMTASIAACVMAVSAFSAPMQVFADMQAAESLTENERLFTAESGTCGENLTWELDDEGTLTISGSGEMNEYGLFGDYSPWFESRESIKTVVIENGVTNIGAGAFNCCDALTSITIPNSVKTIGGYAFNNCSSLTSITIPYGVTKIGWSAFCGCDSLETIIFPESITSIDCDAFLGTPWINAKIEENPYVVVNNILINTPAIDDSFSIPAGVTTIGGDAFFARNIESLVLPEGITTIDSGAFRECRLHSLTLPESLTTIQSYALSGLEFDSIVLPDNVVNVGEAAFDYCSNLKEVALSSGMKDIPQWAFSNCKSLEKITIPENIECIGKGAFYKCEKLNEVNFLGGNINKIEEGAFYSCTELKEVTIPDTVAVIEDFSLGFYADSETNEDVKIENFTIKGVKGSSAEIYAAENGFNFVEINNSASTDTGDLNGDGKIDISDATIVLTMYANIAAGTDVSDESILKAADIDGDGLITLTDATHILTYYAHTAAGIETSWAEILNK